MTIYDTLSKESTIKGENNDCAVKAVAVATDYHEDYDGVHYAFSLCGRRFRKRTSFNITRRVVSALGFELEDVTHHFGSRTIRTLEREIRHRSGGYLVRTGGRTTGHLVGVKDGKIIDWTSGRCNRIKEIYRVIPKKS